MHLYAYLLLALQVLLLICEQFRKQKNILRRFEWASALQKVWHVYECG